MWDFLKSGWFDAEWPIYHSSLIIYYSSTLFVLFDHHYYYTDHFSLFYFYFFPHIFHFRWLMQMPHIIPVLLFITHEHSITHQDIFFTIVFAWTMLTSHIIQVLLFITHQLIFFFLINTSPPRPTLDGWCYVQFHPSFYLVLLSFSLSSCQLFHPTHGLFLFYFALPLLGLHIFHDVHPTL